MPTAASIQNQRHAYNYNKRNPNTALAQKRLQPNKKHHSVIKNEPSSNIFPFIGIQRSNSNLSLSSLSLSQNSNDDSSVGSSVCSWEQKVLSFRGILSAWGNKNDDDHVVEDDVVGRYHDDDDDDDDDEIGDVLNEYLECHEEPGRLKRCSWITKSSDEAYVSFHDECWGVPIYNDNRLFELLSLSGLLIDYNWTEILKTKELYREAFKGFDYNVVARMDEKDIDDIVSNKELKLAECRVRSIIENAKCVQKVAKEFGSFSGYIWGHVNHKPVIGRYKHHRSVPLRTPKSEFISKDLIRRGFRLVGPVIIYSFMQATGMVIDHLFDCYRFNECVKLAERSWGMTNVAV